MRRRFVYAVLIVIVFIIIIMTGTNIYLDLLWFNELGAEQVFITQYVTKWSLRLGAWLFMFLVLFINLMLTRRFVVSFPNLALREKLMASGAMTYFTPRRITFIFVIASGVISFMLTGYTGEYWMELLRYFNHVPFHISDPVFNHDLAVYVFQLPFYRFIYGYLMMILVVTLLLVGALYLLLNPQPAGKKNWLLQPFKGISHLAVILAAIYGLKAWDYHLKKMELLLSHRGVVFGAGYTDINANLPVLQVMLFLALAIALLFITNAFIRRPRLFLYGILALIGVSMLGGAIYPAAIQSFVVEPSEFSYEREYLAHNIEFTRNAYGIDQFRTRTFNPSRDLTWPDLLDNPGTINNVRLWDYRPLLTTFNEEQAIRPYYRFLDVDIDRYMIGDEYRQIMLSARELDKSRLATQAQTWVNLHLQYTHGYGVTMSPVNEVSPEGLPRYFLGDIPPGGEVGLANPAIYFGELTTDYVIVNTDTPEFHYAIGGDDNVYTSYDGTAGIPLQSFFRRVLFSLKFSEYRILISNELSNESRIIFDRSIQQRVRKIAPFLIYDRDPYIVVNEDRLFWVQDAYTYSASYPYSAPYRDINYIRNSVKVIIDAYNGTVEYYISDPADPLIQTYNLIYPDFFKPMDDMPDGLMKHLRYPEDLFNIQAEMYKLYHITDPNVFYLREDLWAIPFEQSFGQEQLMEPYYTILQLPDYSEPEYVLILPFTPDKRNNMIAWMVARCDQPNYGQIEVFLFPKDRVIYGPRQIENRIDQNTDISEQFTLWGQAGSSVIRGNLLVLPINESLLYVEPIFLEADRGGLPELARVIVVFEETVVMENTLEEALIAIFGERADLPPDIDDEELPIDTDDEAAERPDLPSVDDTRVLELIRRAQAVYSDMIDRSQEGDWAGYGDKLKELEEILNELSRLSS